MKNRAVDSENLQEIELRRYKLSELKTCRISPMNRNFPRKQSA